ncbi:MAG TPA: glutaredoxin family protein [Burkholderiales bacterium]|nr:glutaredoxin family protein [Burkholderiales bacterium]
MRIFFVAAAILSLACSEASAQAYRWVDQDGRVHYTQTPPPPEARNVQRKNFRGGGVDVSSLPYATQVAMRNFPVTLYSAPDCGGPCDQARALLVKRGVPFKEVTAETPKDVDELKRLSGKAQLPFLIVGSQTQSGFREDLYNGLLDSAAYPASGAQLPLEALRTMAPPSGPVAAPKDASQDARTGAIQEPGAAK